MDIVLSRACFALFALRKRARLSTSHSASQVERWKRESRQYRDDVCVLLKRVFSFGENMTQRVNLPSQAVVLRCRRARCEPASQNSGKEHPVSRQELVKRDRQVADTDAGRVIDGIGDRSSGPDNPNLANPFRAHRANI